MPKSKIKKEKLIIGWREWIKLPDLHVEAIKAKIDTGAKTSAIHAENIKFIKRRGRQMVKFDIYPFQKNKTKKNTATAELFDMRQVRSSNGQMEKRPVIITDIQLDGETWPIEMTLTKRDVMGFRMLLGRQAFQGRCVVDVEKSYLAEKRQKKKKKEK